MRVTSLSGSRVLAEFQSDADLSEYYVLLLLLVPHLDDEELRELVRRSRWIDRMTANLLLVVVFWKSRDDSIDIGVDDSTLRTRLLEGDIDAEGLRSLAHGFVDEASALAAELDIPISRLPCIVAIDNPSSQSFHVHPYRNVKSFESFTRKLVDYLRTKFPEHSRMKKEEAKLQELLTRIQAGPTKRAWRNAGRSQQVQNVLDTALMATMAQKGEEADRLVRRLTYMKSNPGDQSAAKKAEADMKVLGIQSPFREMEQVWRETFERTEYGDIAARIEERYCKLKEHKRTLDRPSLDDFFRHSARRESIRGAFTGGRTALDTVDSIGGKVVKWAKVVGSLL